MPNQHKTPILGWHPPAEASAWVRAEAERRRVPLKVILNEALSEYRERRYDCCGHCNHDISDPPHETPCREGCGEDSADYGSGLRPDEYCQPEAWKA